MVIGTVVRLINSAANYGVITKINKKTFVVESNAGSRVLYNLIPFEFNTYICVNKALKCNPCHEINQSVYEGELYRGKWFTDELNKKICCLYKNLKMRA
jgi:hypothetical protein